MRRFGKIAALCLVGLVACGGEDSELGVGEPETKRQTNVAVVVVRPDTMTQIGRYPASVEAWRDVQLSFLESGSVAKIERALGDSVKKGDLIARLHTYLLDAALIEAQAGAKFHRYNYENSRQLFDDGTISEQDLYAAEYEERRAASALATVRQRLKNATLLAPFTGEVAARWIEVGDLAQPGQPAVRLVQGDTVRMTAWLPEGDIGDFAVGRSVEVQIDALGSRSFTGEVDRVGPAAETERRVYPLEVRIENGDGELKPGMAGKLRAQRRRMENVLVIPRDALVERESGPIVFVVENEKAVLRDVVLGPSEGHRVVVRQGLAAGDTLVVAGGRDLISGEGVAIRNVIR